MRRGRLRTDVRIVTTAFATVALCLTLTSASVRAQSLAEVVKPKFEVASIRPNKNQGVGSVNLTQTGSHLTASNVSLKFLIIQAYRMARVNFGENPTGDDWIESAHFDIEAVAEGTPTVEEKRLMIQSLLADRFKLTMHHEIRQLPVYALVLSRSEKTGSQLQLHSENTKCIDVPVGRPQPDVVPGVRWSPPCGGFRVVGNDLAGQNVMMERFAATLGILLDRNVVDRTGLAGTYDLILHFERSSVDPNAVAPDPLGPPSIFTALQEQLGLKLESQTAPMDVLVIDHVEKPSEN
jgi:uncharacterized protein (TIGR03435 family)